MRASLSRFKRGMIGGHSALGFAIVLFGNAVWAQNAAPASGGVDMDWLRYEWLKPDTNQQNQATGGGTVTASAGQNVKDPSSVLSTGALWQEQYDAIYTRRLDDALSLIYETNGTTFNEASDVGSSLSDGSGEDLSSGQKMGLQFQPAETLTLHAYLHDSASDTEVTSGAGFWAESRLPTNSEFSFGLNSDYTGADSIAGNGSSQTAYDAQLKQPLGKLPLTAVLKGHYEESDEAGAPVGHSPSMEQSLVWKPMQESTVQLGLRQQQYEEYPGITNQFNQAIFADWSQQLADEISWHSYAEVLNSRGMIDQAPASPIASGTNGTAQATIPGSNAGSLTSTLPLSFEDQTLTFSTGPSIRLEKDISASIEYSNRWDRNAAQGDTGQEQRVSVSVKGTF